MKRFLLAAMAKGTSSADIPSLIILVIGALAGMVMLFIIITDETARPTARLPSIETTGVHPDTK